MYIQGAIDIASWHSQERGEIDRDRLSLNDTVVDALRQLTRLRDRLDGRMGRAMRYSEDHRANSVDNEDLRQQIENLSVHIQDISVVLNKFRNDHTYVRLTGSGSGGSRNTSSATSGGGSPPESIFRAGGSSHGLFTSKGSNTGGGNSGGNRHGSLLHPSLHRGFSSSESQYNYFDETTGKTRKCTVNPTPLSSNQIEITYEVQCSCRGSNLRNADGTPVSAISVKKGDILKYRENGTNNEQDVIVHELKDIISEIDERGQPIKDREVYILCTRQISPAPDGTFYQLTPMSPRRYI